MSEQTMRQRIVRALKPLNALSVENPVYPGTPDVNYVEGWIELKWLRRWPLNCEKSPVLIEHFTPQQRVWLLKRSRAGGNVHLLLQVGHEYLLFEGAIAARVVGRATKTELWEAASRVWERGMKDEELIECLRENLGDLLAANGC